MPKARRAILVPVKPLKTWDTGDGAVQCVFDSKGYLQAMHFTSVTRARQVRHLSKRQGQEFTLYVEDD